MARKEKKIRGRSIATGGILGLLILFLFNGGLNLDVGNPSGVNKNSADTEEMAQAIENEDEINGEMTLEIIDNVLYVNEVAVEIDQVLDTLGNAKQVILRAKDAKQVIYDEVKTLLQDADIVIIEE